MTSIISSQQVSWWSVHEWVAPRLDKVSQWPLLGTPAWELLDDRDPVKWAGAIDGSQHWALHLELNQEARADASRAIAGAADWTKLSREINQRANFYAARPWLKREAS
jgi:hypothetical protein